MISNSITNVSSCSHSKWKQVIAAWSFVIAVMFRVVFVCVSLYVDAVYVCMKINVQLSPFSKYIFKLLLKWNNIFYHQRWEMCAHLLSCFLSFTSLRFLLSSISSPQWKLQKWESQGSACNTYYISFQVQTQLRIKSQGTHKQPP